MKKDLKMINIFYGFIEYFIDNEDVYKKILIDETAQNYKKAVGYIDAVKEFKKSVKRFHKYGSNEEDSLIATLAYWKAKGYKRDKIKSHRKLDGK